MKNLFWSCYVVITRICSLNRKVINFFSTVPINFASHWFCYISWFSSEINHKLFIESSLLIENQKLQYGEPILIWNTFSCNLMKTMLFKWLMVILKLFFFMRLFLTLRVHYVYYITIFYEEKHIFPLRLNFFHLFVYQNYTPIVMQT